MKGSKPQVEVAIAVVRRESEVLICLRRPNGTFGGYWEFPGGKVEAGESPAACAVREVWEEVGLEVRVAEELGVIEHEYEKTWVRLHPFVCQPVAGEARAIECAEVRWVAAGELGAYRFPEANVALLEALGPWK